MLVLIRKTGWHERRGAYSEGCDAENGSGDGEEVDHVCGGFWLVVVVVELSGVDWIGGCCVDVVGCCDELLLVDSDGDYISLRSRLSNSERSIVVSLSLC